MKCFDLHSGLLCGKERIISRSKKLLLTKYNTKKVNVKD